MISPQPQFDSISTNLYAQDYYTWLTQTAVLLRHQAFNQLDLENLIETIDDMGRSEKRALESNLRVVLWHLLKWTYQPQSRTGSWRGSIAEHRVRLRKGLQESPSLTPYLTTILAETYEDAVKIASQETGLEASRFPKTCEWTTTQILDEAWLPD